MKIIRCRTDDDSIVSAALQADGTALVLDGALLSEPRPSERRVRVAELLAPLEPRQIIGIGLNYRRHAEESGMPLPRYPIVFAKTLNAVQGPDAPIALPGGGRGEKVDYECELAVVVGRDAKDVTREEALEYVLGYTCANDVSARDWQLEKGGGQWSYGKSFDTFCPLGPVLVTRDELPAPNALAISTALNGRLVQDWRTDDMIFDVADLVAFLSAGTTLLAGTVILTGTPHGVGMGQDPPRWLRPGDEVTVTIEGIGTLRNPVIGAA
jgi:2-keto-4-pentenoate hydratase/2-oxohepta-3-ene-1,7-dioic acid hydratase in catechol pathway